MTQPLFMVQPDPHARPIPPTECLWVDPARPDPAVLDRAAAWLARGEIVAFPTETVYGLGADALNPAAVAKIFEAKGRPAANPLIVHVAGFAAARRLVTAWPESAQRLAERFWPGPLTLVLPAGPEVPPIVTAGGSTVGLRMPAHPVALALLERAQRPLAAPSANRSNSISPTQADHVLSSLGGRIGLVLDGGRCPGGLESTVVDLTGPRPRLLRPGLIAPDELAAVLGTPIERASQSPPAEGPLRSPGMLARHYAPAARLEVLEPSSVLPRLAELLALHSRVGWLACGSGEAAIACESPGLLRLELPDDASGYASQLYAALHTFDAAEVGWILVSRPPQKLGWEAIHDRLARASVAGTPGD